MCCGPGASVNIRGVGVGGACASFRKDWGGPRQPGFGAPPSPATFGDPRSQAELRVPLSPAGLSSEPSLSRPHSGSPPSPARVRGPPRPATSGDPRSQVTLEGPARPGATLQGEFHPLPGSGLWWRLLTVGFAGCPARPGWGSRGGSPCGCPSGLAGRPGSASL